MPPCLGGQGKPMFIKANLRGGYRQAADYLKDIGENETSRLIGISDPHASNLDEAFHNMWAVASRTKAKKPLLHFSINPYKENITDKVAKQIAILYAARCNLDLKTHQWVMVEHVKDGRQHYHVIVNRVSPITRRCIDPGLFKKKAREVSREVEIKFGLNRLERHPRTPRLGKGRSLHDYAGMLGDIDTPQPTRRKKKGDGEGKSDGSGGGMGSMLSLFKATARHHTSRQGSGAPHGQASTGVGADRRRANKWVAVERRSRRPRDGSPPAPR